MVGKSFTAELVEYGAAVDRYLESAGLSAASARVYRISLTGWAWPLVDRRAPVGRERRGARPPAAPLALLDDPRTPDRLRRAVRLRAQHTDPRTLVRELACLRAAVAWWREQGWVAGDPAAELVVPLEATPAGSAVVSADPPDRARAALGLPAPLRELTLWNLIRESAAPVGRLLALDIEQLDLPGRRTKPGSPRSPGSPGSPGSPPPPVRWGPATARLLPMLLLGRTSGPVFITDRRAPAGTPATDRCPVTGRARLSYRRAAEIFAAATSGLDPAGRGWPLLTLRVSRRGGGRCG